MSLNESAPIKGLLDYEPGVQNPVSTVPQEGPINPNNPPWGLFQALLIWVLSIAILIVIPLLLLVPYVIYQVAVHGRAAAPISSDPNLVFLSILGVLPAHIITFIMIWWVVTRGGRQPFWKTLGWSWPRHFGPWKTIGIAVLLFGGGWLVTYFVGGGETQLDQIIKSSYKARFATAALAAITGPFVEELIYRGVLYSALQRAIGVLSAVLVVSVLFTAVHVVQYYNNFGVISVIAVLSVALTVVRARTGKLLPSYVIHLVFNGIQAVLLVVAPLLEKGHGGQNAAPGLLTNILARIFG